MVRWQARAFAYHALDLGVFAIQLDLRMEYRTDNKLTIEQKCTP